MKNIKYYLTVIFLMLFIWSETNTALVQEEKKYSVLQIKNNITEGKEKEITPLYEKNQRKIVQLTLRNGQKLETHKVDVPILIQCISGEGELVIQNDKKLETIKLNTGVTVIIEADILHDVIALPEVSILLIKFPKETK